MKASKKLFSQYLFIVLCVFLSSSLFAQDVKNHTNGNNEFKINVGSLLLEFPEFSYDYIINEESTAGVSLAFSIDKGIGYKFFVYPNYRLFFGRKRAAGFFIEGNAAFYSQKYENYDNAHYINIKNNAMGFGLGIAVGGKFITKNGFIGELYLGGGRNFLNTDKIDEGYPRIGISIGKRF
ncbi:MAG: DUF3575 domain-containing protein [Flavobacteriaceae bacterium]|jgi:hypothetical protein|nr:DUF3575 domain-containing protein [Flavobacteriaceae bacterium]